MNAVLTRRSDSQDRYPVPYAEDDAMDESLSVLRADFRNLQIHVTDIKAEVRATNSRLDSLRDKIEQYRDEDNKRIDDKLDDRFGKIDERFDKLDGRFGKIDDRFEEARKETKADFTAVRGEIAGLRGTFATTMRWAVGLYFAGLGGILAVMAHGFKWF